MVCRLTWIIQNGNHTATDIRFPYSIKILTPASVKTSTKLFFNTKRYVQLPSHPDKQRA